MVETLETKANRLEDFMFIAEDSHLVLKDLFEQCKYFLFILIFSLVDRVESFLKSQESFRQHCLTLHQKSTLILDWQETLLSFVKGLEEIQAREKYLDKEPIQDAYGKLEKLAKLKLSHAQ